MKKLFMGFGVIVALLFCSCAKTAYKAVIPSDALMVAELDVKSVALKSDLKDQKDDLEEVMKLMASEDDSMVKAIKKGLEEGCIDFMSPMYMFVPNDLEEMAGFVLISIKDDDKMAEVLKALGVELNEKDGVRWLSIEDALFGVLNDELLLMGSEQERKPYQEMLDRKASDSFFASEPGKFMSKNAKDITLMCDFTTIEPRELKALVGSFAREANIPGEMLDKYCDMLCEMKAVVNLEFNKGEILLNLFSQGGDKDRFEKMFTEKISKDALGYIDDDHLYGFLAMSIRGEEMKDELDKSLDELASMDPSEGAILDAVKDYVEQLNGTMVAAISGRNLNDPKILCLLPTAKSNTVSAINDLGAGGQFDDYLKGDGEYTAFSLDPSYKFKGAASPTDKISEAKDCYLYAYVNIAQLLKQDFGSMLSREEKDLLGLADYAELKISEPEHLSLSLKLTDDSDNVLEILLRKSIELARKEAN